MKLPPHVHEPGKLAPGDLAVVQEFLNTLDIESGADELATTAEATDWLRAYGLLGAGERVGAEELELAHALRRALRALLRANNGAALDEGARRLLEDAARRLPMRFAVAEDGALVAVPAADGANAALGRLLAAAQAAMLRGEWARLKACGEETCQWVFYDHSRNRSRTWCSMEVCGNRNKVRNHRERLAGA